jgi:hypothetical protein
MWHENNVAQDGLAVAAEWHAGRGRAIGPYRVHDLWRVRTCRTYRHATGA